MLSTPDICCSTGVATDWASVTASAPGYVAFTCICGSAMFGNCAMGSCTSDTKPRSTIRMEMTIATMGRLMKNFDMIWVGLPRLLLFGGLRRRVRCRRGASLFSRERHWIHRRALTHLLHPFGHDALSRFHVAGDHPIRADLFAGLYRADADFVVRADDGDEIAALHVGHGALRHQQRIGDGGQQSTYVDKHPGDQQHLRVGELADDADRAGLHIHLVVLESKSSFGRVN